jgi:hypothetical protein
MSGVREMKNHEGKARPMEAWGFTQDDKFVGDDDLRRSGEPGPKGLWFALFFVGLKPHASTRGGLEQKSSGCYVRGGSL